MIHNIIIAFGTNAGINRIREAKALLRKNFTVISFSRVMQTEPIGKQFQGTIFYNAIACCSTHIAKADNIVNILKALEKESGDREELRKAGKVVLDLDLLKYDNVVYHKDDWNRGYIKELTQDITEHL